MGSSSTEKALITYQTDPWESYLIGTKDQLLAFAQTIIEAVESATEDDFCGYPVKATHFSESVLDSRAEIGLDEVVVVKTNENKKGLFYAIYNNS